MDGRRALRVAGWAALGLGALLAALVWLACTAAGGRLLARGLERATRGAVPYALRLDGLDLDLGPGGGRLRVAHAALADAAGPWLEVRELDLELALWPLLAGRVNLPRLAARQVRLERLPDDAAAPEAAMPPARDAAPGPWRLPLLAQMRLGALDVARLDLGPGVAGAWRAYAVSGAVRAGAGGLDARVHAHGLGDLGDPGNQDIQGPQAPQIPQPPDAERLDLDAAWNPAGPALRLALDAEDPAGILARLAGLPGGAARVRLTLAGPPEALTGEVAARMAGLGSLDGGIGARAGSGAPGMDFSGRVALEPGVLPGEAEAVLGRTATLAGAATLDGAALRVRGLTLGLAPGALTLDGGLDLDSGRLDWRAEAAPGLVLAAAREAGVALDAPGALALDGQGPPERMAVRAALQARGLTWEDVALAGPGLEASATLDAVRGAALAAGLRGEWAGLALAGWPLGPGTARAALRPGGPGGGTPDAPDAPDAPNAEDKDSWLVDEISLALPGAGTALDGTGTLGAAGATARVRLALTDLGLLDGAPEAARGTALDLDADLTTGGADGWSEVRAAYTGRLRPGPGLPAPVGALLGPQAALGGGVTLDLGAAMRLDLSGATLKARALDATLNGTWGLADDALALAARAEAATLALDAQGAAVLRGLGLDLNLDGTLDGGTARARWTLDGADLPGAALRAASGRATARGPWAAPVVELDLRTEVLAGALAAVAGEAVPSLPGAPGAPGESVLSSAKGAKGAEDAPGTGGPWLPLALDAALAWNPSTHGLDGTARLIQEQAVPALRALEARAELAATPAGQRVELTARAGRLRLGALSGRGAALRAVVADALGSPTLDGAADLEALALGGLTLDTAHLAARGPLQALDFTARGTGRAAGGATAVEIAGALALGDAGGSLRLDAARGRWAGLALALAHTARLEWGTAGWRLAGLAASLGPGSLRADAARNGREVTLAARARRLPLGPLLELAGLPLAGDLDADLDAHGPAGQPQMTLGASGGLRALAAPMGAPGAAAPEAAFTLRGDAGPGGTALTLALDAGNGTRLDAGATLPLRPDATLPGFISLAPGPSVADGVSNAALDGFARGRLDLALVEALVADEEQQFSGTLDLDATLGGTWEHPQARGTARVDGARYEHTGLGLILASLHAEAAFENDALRLRSLSATDGGSGRVEATGHWTPGAHPAFALHAALRQATVLRHRWVTAMADGSLDLEDAAPLPVLRGRLALPQVEVRVPEELPGGPPELEVREINVPEELARGAAAGQEAAPAAPLALAVALDVPGRFHVRGRGLEVEFRGGVTAGGSTAAPVLGGQLATVRGTFRFLDRVFDITTGTLVFTGASLVPDLDVEAGVSVSDTEVTATLQGPADHFTLALESEPSLPRDEIISRLLFGRSMASLSPVQAFQLASALRQLSGGGGGFDPVGTLRALAGLDQLGVSQGEDGQGMRVGAGKYIHERVYLEVQHDTGSGEDSVSVDVELTPDVGVTGTAGASAGGVGVYWKKDY
jgi:translocation and assembly module TamB